MVAVLASLWLLIIVFESLATIGRQVRRG